MNYYKSYGVCVAHFWRQHTYVLSNRWVNTEEKVFFLFGRQQLNFWRNWNYWIFHFLICFILNFILLLIKVELATVVEGDQKAPFSIATTPRCWGGRYSFPWIAPLYPRYVSYIAECSARRYQVPLLKSLVWRNQGLNPGLPDHWWTLGQCCNISLSMYG